MQLSRSTPPATLSNAGLVFLIGLDPERPGELSWPALAALAAADAVLHDATIAADTLSLVPGRCFVEALGDDVARVGKLALEGWRVVWLVAGDAATWPGALVEAEHLAAAGIAIGTIASVAATGRDGATAIAGRTSRASPQSFATALNGLAG
ncbi:MAG: hypothetical protein ACREE2_05165 [Stellaceae bacterium]